MNHLRRDLTKTIAVEIVPEGEGDILTDRIWAIYWFNYKKKWLYTLYNRLAAPHVIKVGGELLFKGHNQKTLLGDSEWARQTLLIVTYPKIDNFLEMLTVKAFQLKSLLRVKAVKDFVFGFTKRIDLNKTDSSSIVRQNNSYLVFHYQGAFDQSKIYELAEEYNLQVFFHGAKMALLKRIEEGKEDVLAPFFMDGILLFNSDSANNYNDFVTSEKFKAICQDTTSCYAAIFDRVR